MIPFGGYALTLTQYVGPRVLGEFFPFRKPTERELVGTPWADDIEPL